MDMYSSSAEDQITKTRKPYTITKQREKWTDPEHSRFLEALKLYGRAWQRIEEHIGTKTAVQIRSHAQKFFSKLEKEALGKGTPLGRTHDIDIPPPRPKRKPCTPYPRKTNAGVPNASAVGVKDLDLLISASSSYPASQMLDIEHYPLSQKPGETENATRTEENLDNHNCSEVLTLFREAPCSSISSDSKISPTSGVLTKPCALREFMPSIKESISSLAEEHQKLKQIDSDYTYEDDGVNGLRNLDLCNQKILNKVDQGKRTEQSKQPKQSSETRRASQTYPRHIPVHVVDSSSGTCSQPPAPEITCPASIIRQVEGVRDPNLVTVSSAYATTEHHSNVSLPHSLPNSACSIPLINNEDSYRYFLNSSFSSPIISTLLQHPAAHAAARFAASFWPSPNMEIFLGSPFGSTEGFSSRQGSQPPSMAAIAAATVAAASAWWAANGLLPMCPPLHSGFACTPRPANTIPLDANQPQAVSSNSTSQDPPLEGQKLDPQFSEAFKSPLPSSESENNSGDTRLNTAELEAAGHKQKIVPSSGMHESDEAKIRGQVDRSSCGSNTASSSEVETYMLKKHVIVLEGSEEHNVNHWTSEQSNYHRSRGTSNMNESWREVSQEGRVAFRALFSREVLPQSFSPSQKEGKMGHLKTSDEEKLKSEEKGEEDYLLLDLNSKTIGSCLDHQVLETRGIGNNAKKELCFMGVGHVKHKTHRTGFKPYKRCSGEVKEGRRITGSDEGGERDTKRIRVDKQALT